MDFNQLPRNIQVEKIMRAANEADEPDKAKRVKSKYYHKKSSESNSRFDVVWFRLGFNTALHFCGFWYSKQLPLREYGQKQICFGAILEKMHF